MHPRLEGAASDEGGQGHHVTHNTAEIVAQSDKHKAITEKDRGKAKGVKIDLQQALFFLLLLQKLRLCILQVRLRNGSQRWEGVPWR